MSNAALDKHTDERDTRDARYDHLMIGEVVSNEDPLNLGRVQVRVPGILEPSSDWAPQVGQMLGVKEGVWAVPKVGSNVVVFLNQGDVDAPFYMTGPFGSPEGESDVPEQATSDVDYYVLRWRQFHLVINGKPGEEKIFVTDEVSGTKLEIDRINGPGDFLRDVEGNETVEVALDRDVTVETGDSTFSVAQGDHDKVVALGDDSETIGGDKTKQVGGGETIDILGSAGQVVNILGTAGKTENTPSGPSTENVGLAKSIIAGLAVNITAGAAMTLQAGGLMSITGSGLTLNSGGGPTTQISGGVANHSFLGALTETITGLLTQNLNGAATITVTGLYQLIGNAIALGITANLKKLVTEDVFALWANSHTHSGVMSGPGNTGTPNEAVFPGASAPNVDLDDVTTQNVQAS